MSPDDAPSDLAATNPAPTSHAPGILGVLNVSPESMVKESIATTPEAIRARAEMLRRTGADLIDLGARSITPDAARIDDREEQARLRPALRLLVQEGHRVSVDTWSTQTALTALDHGAAAINFTGAALEAPLLDAVAARGATLFITFMPYPDAYAMRDAAPAPVGLTAILEHLAPRVEAARRAGVAEVVIDPNLGIIHAGTDELAKIHHQLGIVWNLAALRTLGCPILLYAARKPEPMARIMMASAVVHARPDYIRTHTPEMIERLLHVDD